MANKAETGKTETGKTETGKTAGATGRSPVQAPPNGGGSYVRDPQTGALTRQEGTKPSTYQERKALTKAGSTR